MSDDKTEAEAVDEVEVEVEETEEADETDSVSEGAEAEEEVADAAGSNDVAAESTALYGCPTSQSRNQMVLHPNRDDWFDVATALFQDSWNMCVDVTAVDFLTYEPSRNLPDGIAPERFELVASFISHQRRERIRARVQLSADDPSIASLYQLYPGTDHLEREVFDLFGINFEGHPDLSRILMPETWQGHPLRKDFALGRIPVQFKGSQHEAGKQ